MSRWRLMVLIALGLCLVPGLLQAAPKGGDSSGQLGHEADALGDRRVVLGEHVFRIPRPYWDQGPAAEGPFSLLVYLPDLQPYSAGRPAPGADLIQINVEAGSLDGVEAVVRRRRNILQEHGTALPSSPDRPGLVRYRLGDGHGRYLFSAGRDDTRVPQTIMFDCSPVAASRFDSGLCSTRYVALDGVVVHFLFPPDVMPEWQHLLNRISALLDAFKE
jgi:hypothetical protein